MCDKTLERLQGTAYGNRKTGVVIDNKSARAKSSGARSENGRLRHVFMMKCLYMPGNIQIHIYITINDFRL